MWEQIADLPHTLEYVQVGEWTTRVLSVGAGEQTLVLLNGTSGHIEAWTHNIRALAQKYRVIGYDYPGHGYSTLADADLEIPDYEAHLLELLDVLGLDRVHLLGESLGGWIAIKFAAHHPETTAKRCPQCTRRPNDRQQLDGPGKPGEPEGCRGADVRERQGSTASGHSRSRTDHR